MNTLPRPLRFVIVIAGALALSLAGWACTGSAPRAPDGGACLSPSAAPSPPPKKTCDPDKDVSKECPLPASQTKPDLNSSFDTVYYFSDPVCESGVCTYCLTTTQVEDPCATAVCPP